VYRNTYILLCRCNIYVIKSSHLRLNLIWAQNRTKQNQKPNTVLTNAYLEHKKGLKTRAFFKVHNTETSEDLVQDTFMKTWIYLVKGGKIDIMKAFLYNILNNLIVDEYRKHKTVSLDALIEKGFEPNTNNPERFFDILDGKAAFLFIQRLPEKYQKVMKMKYVQDLTLKEISLLMGQSKNTIAVQLHRGLRKLKKLYNRD